MARRGCLGVTRFAGAKSSRSAKTGLARTRATDDGQPGFCNTARQTDWTSTRLPCAARGVLSARCRMKRRLHCVEHVEQTRCTAPASPTPKSPQLLPDEHELSQTPHERRRSTKPSSSEPRSGAQLTPREPRLEPGRRQSVQSCLEVPDRLGLRLRATALTGPNQSSSEASELDLA
jgi:hypothetical protein